ncbi:MAG TPA: AGE family epimerase/isomerase [Solirubrobacteraceae bacterium]|nr:AGE family epimerase/isomerase [Solirubrobacteraceae bacterium]
MAVRASTESWLELPAHRAWARTHVAELLRFFRASLDPGGRFRELDDDGRVLVSGAPPASPPRQQLLTVTRVVHCYALGEMLGIPGCATVVERGLETLWEEHRDPEHGGGYLSAIGLDGTPLDTTKAAYAHAHVLLAAAAGRAAGHALAEPLFDDALQVIERRFWREEQGASAEDHDRDWNELEDYRGANSNMHLCEALLAAAEVSSDQGLAERAEAIARTFIDGHARRGDWLLAEHYTAAFRPLPDYNRDRIDDPFRPYGATIGHSLEWARLVLGCAQATGADGGSWQLEAAEALFARGVRDGWDAEHGGLWYTVDWDGRPVNSDHYWWPVAEGIQTSATLLQTTGRPLYEEWYRRLWEFAADHLIDEDRGGWYPQLTAENARTADPWYGKPDVYHVLQAYLAPLLPAAPSLIGAVRRARELG